MISSGPVPSPGRLVAALMVLMGLGFALLVFATLRSDSALLIDASYYGVMALAVTLGTARVISTSVERGAWVLMTLALLSDLIADLMWTYVDQSFPSTADALWLASYVFLLSALILLGRDRLGRTGKAIWLDGVIATLTLSALGAALILPAIISGLPDESLASAAILAYPVADTVVLAAIVVILAIGGRQISRSWYGIIAATIVWAIGDAIFSYQDAIGTYTAGATIDLTWPFAAMLIALSAWTPAPRPVRNLAANERAGWLAASCGLIALGIVLAGDFTDLSEFSFYLAVAALAGVGVRLLLAHRENEKLLLRAETDALTGIGSRGKLGTDIANLEMSDQEVTVAIFDLDGFKFYNDSFGHPAGDRLLRRLATRMRSMVGDRGSVYRIGGDEFVALLWGSEHECGPLIDQIASAMIEQGDGFDLSASRGAAGYPAECATIDLAIMLADERMYSAKASSRTSARNQVHETLVRSIREWEPDLADHTSRVSDLALAVARRFVDDPEDLDVIERAGHLHDVGKVAIPDAILSKPGPLDEEERKLMQQHTVIGERIIAASPALAPVGVLVRHSHEHWDGSGYPDGLRGLEIPLGARIILACDALEAMTTQRPYNSPRSVAEAIEELHLRAGKQFDPDVVKVLIDVLNEEPADGPPGSDTITIASDSAG